MTLILAIPTAEGFVMAWITQLISGSFMNKDLGV